MNTKLKCYTKHVNIIIKRLDINNEENSHEYKKI